VEEALRFFKLQIGKFQGSRGFFPPPPPAASPLLVLLVVVVEGRLNEDVGFRVALLLQLLWPFFLFFSFFFFFFSFLVSFLSFFHEAPTHSLLLLLLLLLPLFAGTHRVTAIILLPCWLHLALAFCRTTFFSLFFHFFLFF